jgi:hypothetical protein
MDQPNESVRQAPGKQDSPAIEALAGHLSLPTEAVHAWLSDQKDIPLEVLVSWIGRWHRRRRSEG